MVSEEEERVILVDEADRVIGTAGKLEAHRTGRLHRAFSVVLWNDAGEMLIQQRAAGKYHSGGLWANTCCGHPRPGEPVERAAVRRVREELGVDCVLEPVGEITYRAELDQGLVEHEFVYVFHGTMTSALVPEPSEVSATEWVLPEKLSQEIRSRPDAFAAWLKHYHHAGWPLAKRTVAGSVERMCGVRSSGV